MNLEHQHCLSIAYSCLESNIWNAHLYPTENLWEDNKRSVSACAWTTVCAFLSRHSYVQFHFIQSPKKNQKSSTFNCVGVQTSLYTTIENHLKGFGAYGGSKKAIGWRVCSLCEIQLRTGGEARWNPEKGDNTVEAALLDGSDCMALQHPTKHMSESYICLCVHMVVFGL